MVAGIKADLRPCDRLKVRAGGPPVPYRRHRHPRRDTQMRSRPRGTIGKTVENSGADLLGSNCQTHPQFGFTSVNGSTVAGAITTITAQQMVVAVPNGAATRLVYVT